MSDAPIYFDGEDLPLLPEGRYSLGYVRHQHLKMFKGRKKLVVTFRVVDEGEFFGVEVKRHYNVKEQGRSYRATRSMDIAREFNDVFGKGALKGGLQVSRLADLIVTGEVRTVTTSANNRVLSANNEYSVVGRLLSGTR